MRIFGPAVIFLGEFDFGLTERFAMSFVRILLVRRAVPDVRINNDKGRLVVVLLRVFVAAGKLQKIVGVSNAGDVPAVTDKPRHYVFAERPAGRTVEGDAIVIVNPGEVAEL